MRPPTRTTRSARRASDDENEEYGTAVQTSRRPANSKIATKGGSRGSSRKGATYAVEKKPRHRMTDKQLEQLETLYQQDTHPSREEKQLLGAEVGMDARTVTVWFQNRRQLNKKQSTILGSTPGVMSRHPLRTVSYPNSQLSSRQPSVSSCTQSSGPHTPMLDEYSGHHSKLLELWEHLPSSPTTNTSATASVNPSAMPSPLRKRFPGGPVGEGNGKKRKPILEWACARMAKRHRAQIAFDDLDDEADDSDSDIDRTLVGADVDDLKLGSKGKGLDVSSVDKHCDMAPRPAVSIPSKYNATFSPDVVLGASLLLTFQHWSTR